MSSDGLAPRLSITNTHKNSHYTEGFSEDLNDLNKAAEACPVQILKIIKSFPILDITFPVKKNIALLSIHL
ncbi:MAG: hypothetical protein MK132_27305 [Lentisphaerales bacterium]|nr:hypothetical protein [Lentisphaerales bacterium]